MTKKQASLARRTLLLALVEDTHRDHLEAIANYYDGPTWEYKEALANQKARLWQDINAERDYLFSLN